VKTTVAGPIEVELQGMVIRAVVARDGAVHQCTAPAISTSQRRQVTVGDSITQLSW
jgi:hypothetical protein